jgi:hypothetical protein
VTLCAETIPGADAREWMRATLTATATANGMCRRGSETAQTLTGALAPWLAPIADPQCKYAGQRVL